MDIQIDRVYLLSALDELLVAHAPPGAEGEVKSIVMDKIRPYADAVWTDASDSVVAHIRGGSDSAPVAVVAHMDEIAMIVKRVEPDGRLRVRPLGGLHPWALGEGPVDILGSGKPVPGVLSVGSKHVSSESPAGAVKGGKALTWETLWVETKQTPEALADQGVRVGSKAVVARSRKAPLTMGEFICGYNLDCRGGVAILLETARQLKACPPPQDVYLIASAEEEIGAQGAVYSVGQLPAETVIAVDIAPVAEEYQVKNCGSPVLLYGDSHGVYCERMLGRMEGLAAQLGFDTQAAVVTSYGSDASIAKKSGSAGRAACIAYPGDNTHGYEICSVEGLVNAARLLVAYLQSPI